MFERENGGLAGMDGKNIPKNKKEVTKSVP